MGKSCSDASSSIKSVSAHPNLAQDFNNGSLEAALKNIERLDPDAPRRVKVLRDLMSSEVGTQVLFIDWKDADANRKLFLDKERLLPRKTQEKYEEDLLKKSWSGIAYRSGMVMVRALPGFSPKVEAIRNKIREELNNPKVGDDRPSSLGAGTQGLGNSVLRTLVHEFGHIAHFASGTAPISPFFKKLSKYADTNFKENFAEAFVAYVFNGPQLKAKRPVEYREIESILEICTLHQDNEKRH